MNEWTKIEIATSEVLMDLVSKNALSLSNIANTSFTVNVIRVHVVGDSSTDSIVFSSDSSIS